MQLNDHCSYMVVLYNENDTAAINRFSEMKKKQELFDLQHVDFKTTGNEVDKSILGENIDQKRLTSAK